MAKMNFKIYITYFLLQPSYSPSHCNNNTKPILINLLLFKQHVTNLFQWDDIDKTYKSKVNKAVSHKFSYQETTE